MQIKRCKKTHRRDSLNVPNAGSLFSPERSQEITHPKRVTGKNLGLYLPSIKSNLLLFEALFHKL